MEDVLFLRYPGKKKTPFSNQKFSKTHFQAKFDDMYIAEERRESEIL